MYLCFFWQTQVSCNRSLFTKLSMFMSRHKTQVSCNTSLFTNLSMFMSRHKWSGLLVEPMMREYNDLRLPQVWLKKLKYFIDVNLIYNVWILLNFSINYFRFLCKSLISKCVNFLFSDG